MYQYKKIRLNRKKVVDEHRMIMEGFIGRKLSFNEVVHHKNGNKKDNRIENLEVLSRSEHIRMHIENGDIKSIMSNATKIVLCERNSKLSSEQVDYILKSNEKNIRLAEKFNVSKFVISRLKRGTTWKHKLRVSEVVIALDS